jgi:hypothetical protein
MGILKKKGKKLQSFMDILVIPFIKWIEA